MTTPSFLRRTATFALAGAASVAILAGCKGSISIGGTKVAKADVEKEVSTKLSAQQPDLPTPIIACPDDLKGEVGATLECELSVAGEPTKYGVTVTVTSVEGTDVRFDVKVGDSPLGATTTTP